MTVVSDLCTIDTALINCTCYSDNEDILLYCVLFKNDRCIPYP